MGCKQQRVGTIFYGDSWPLETPSKDFHLAIGGGLGWIKWLKNGLVIFSMFENHEKIK